MPTTLLSWMCLGFWQQKAGPQMASAAREKLLKLRMSRSSAQAHPEDVMEETFRCPWPPGGDPPSVGIFTIQKKKALQEAQGAQLLLVI